jgi:hypothetical protein
MEEETDGSDLAVKRTRAVVVMVPVGVSVGVGVAPGFHGELRGGDLELGFVVVAAVGAGLFGVGVHDHIGGSGGVAIEVGGHELLDTGVVDAVH